MWFTLGFGVEITFPYTKYDYTLGSEKVIVSGYIVIIIGRMGFAWLPLLKWLKSEFLTSSLSILFAVKIKIYDTKMS